MDPSDRISASVLFLIMLGAHIVWHLLGVKFLMFPLLTYWQIADPALLVHNLWQTIFYLHGQPPLFNLFIGLILKTFPHTFHFVFYLCYFLMAYLTVLFVYLISVRLGVNRKIAFVITTLFGVTPEIVCYSHYLFYPMLVAFLWITSVYLLLNFFETGRAFFIWMFALVIAMLALTRSMIHLLYVVGVAALVIWLSPQKRKVIVPLALSVVLVLALYVKNYLLFGEFTSSTWMGLNIAHVALTPIPRETRLNLARRGVISYAAVDFPRCDDPHWPPKRYLAPYSHLPRVPILFQRVKSTRKCNMNYIGYIGYFKDLLKDSLILARLYPQSVLRTIGDSFLIYASPPENYKDCTLNVKAMDGWADVFHKAVYGEMNIWGSKVYVVLLLGIPLLLGYGITKVFKSSGSLRNTLIYIIFSAIYVMLVGNLLDHGENNRFRFQTDPMYVTLLALFLGEFMRGSADLATRRSSSGKETP